MSNTPIQSPWIPLATLRPRLQANLQALQEREPNLARQLRDHQPKDIYFIHALADTVLLGVQAADGARLLPQILPPSRALQIAEQLFPAGKYNQSLLIAGEDLGWLCNRAYQMPVDSFQTHQRPIFLVMRDLERFWVMLHIQDWQTLLADARVRLFIGENAIDSFRRSLLNDVMTPWPTVSVNTDPAMWRSGESTEELLKSAAADMEIKQERLAQQAGAMFADRTDVWIRDKIESGQPLNIMGIATRHSVFVCHSMRDWLEAFERMGHRTQLVIESDAHQIVNKTAVAEALIDFRPDLVLMINHYRAEMSVVPDGVPFVMWAQDWCDNITCTAAGNAQGVMDFVLGHNPIRMSRAFGYPILRYMPAVVAVNDRRFVPQQMNSFQSAEYGCDVSFVGNASTEPKAILEEEIRRIGSIEFGQCLRAIFSDLETIYRDGGSVTQLHRLVPIIDRELASHGIKQSAEQKTAVIDFFSHRINDALFRHQTLHWLAEIGVDLRIYGRGWKTHPTLGRFARGVADNQNELCRVYQASRINLQISPHGVMHQRVMEGLSAGGFFLFRRCSGDQVGRHFKAVAEFCIANDIRGNEDLLSQSTPAIKIHLAAIVQLLRRDPWARPRVNFVEFLKYQAANGYVDSADLLWGDDFEAVCFDSKNELARKVQYYLANPQARCDRTESMRRPVADRYTYLATSRRLLNFIAADLNYRIRKRAAA